MARSRLRTVRSAYDRCAELFAAYPLAVQCADWAGTLHSMVLIVRDGDDADFFTLARDDSEGKPFYSLVPWRPDGPRVYIDADGSAVSGAAAIALSQGIPLPRHGSLFGWLARNQVTALVAVYTKYSPEYPEPSWAVMPPHRRSGTVMAAVHRRGTIRFMVLGVLPGRGHRVAGRANRGESRDGFLGETAKRNSAGIAVSSPATS